MSLFPVFFFSEEQILTYPSPVSARLHDDDNFSFKVFLPDGTFELTSIAKSALNM